MILHLIQHDVFLTLFSISLDKNSICRIRMLKSQFWPVKWPMTQKRAEIGQRDQFHWLKYTLVCHLCTSASPVGMWEFIFLYDYYQDKFVWNFFWFYFYQPQLSLSNSTSYLKTIDLLPFCSLLQLINWILFIAIYLAPSIYQFGDRTVSSNNIDCFQSVRQLNKIYVAKFGLKYVQTSILVIHRLNKCSCFVIVMFLWLFCAVSFGCFPKSCASINDISYFDTFGDIHF